MEKILELKFGSHLYGTDTPESDLDLKGIYIPTGREIILHNYKPTITIARSKAECERNTKDDIDIEIFSLDRYLDLLMQGQTVALDMLFAPNMFHTYYEPDNAVMETIYENRHRLITRNIMAFVGYARQQASKYGIKGSRLDALKRVTELLEPWRITDRLIDHEDELKKLVAECTEMVSLEKTPLVEILYLPNNQGVLERYLHVCGRKIPFMGTVKLAKMCYGKILAEYGSRAKKAHLDGGIDWKALSHAVRVNSEAEELLLTNFIEFPRPDRDLLKQIKLGELPYNQVAEMIEQGLVRLYEAQAKSQLPDEPDQQWVEDFIYAVYSRRVR